MEYLHTPYSFLVMHDKRRKREKGKKDERIEIVMFGFLRKVSGTFGVELAMQYQRDVVCKLIGFLCCFYFVELLAFVHEHPGPSLLKKYRPRETDTPASIRTDSRRRKKGFSLR